MGGFCRIGMGDRFYCRECLVPAAAHLLFDGLCTECVPEHLDIPTADREYLDGVAIEACRKAGLSAVERPCGFEKCSDPRCAVVRQPDPLDTPWLGTRRNERTHSGAFTPLDAADLERFFRTKLPPAAWDHSAFGAMCQRVGESTNPDSDYRPGPDAPWTEIIDVSAAGHGGRFGSWEDQMANYLDARHRQVRVWKVLSRLLPWARDVLEARYGENSESAASKLGVLGAVSLLTDTVRKIRDQRARDGEVEWVKIERADGAGSDKVEGAPTARGVIADLVRLSQSSTASAKNRAAAIATLTNIRTEAEYLLGRAESAYAREASK